MPFVNPDAYFKSLREAVDFWANAYRDMETENSVLKNTIAELNAVDINRREYMMSLDERFNLAYNDSKRWETRALAAEAILLRGQKMQEFPLELMGEILAAALRF